MSAAFSRFAPSVRRRWVAAVFLAVSVLVASPLDRAAAEQPLRVVATGGRMATLTYTTSATSTAFWHRSPHQLGGPVTEIRLGFMNWYHSTSAEVANSNPVTIEHAWLERASTGQVVPVTFAGGRQLVMPADSAIAYHLADPIPASVWTGAPPARDELFWIQAKGSLPAGGKVCLGNPTRHAGSRFIVYDPANDPGAVDTTGAVPSISGGNTRTQGLATLFAGRYAGPGHLAVIGVGDSILAGYSDHYTSAPISGTSPLGRASVDADGLNTIATMHLARSGESAGTWVNHHQRQEQLLVFANVLVEEFGTNDIGQNGSNANAAVIAGRLDTIWSVARDAGVQRIVRTRLLPRTQSASKDWLSKEDQTPNPGWGEGGARDAVNAALDVALGEGRIDVLVDTLSVVADPTDDHYWFTNGIADHLTGDGTHPYALANALLAEPLRAALLTLSVDPANDGHADYASWAEGIEWAGANSSPEADPNGDGINNLLAYALAVPPLETVVADRLPSIRRVDDEDGFAWLALSYRENQAATDLTFTVQRSPDLSLWSDVEIDGVTAKREVLTSDADGDARVAHVQVRVTIPPGNKAEFLRLDVRR